MPALTAGRPLYVRADRVIAQIAIPAVAGQPGRHGDNAVTPGHPLAAFFTVSHIFTLLGGVVSPLPPFQS